MNVFSVTGNLGKDGELKTISSGEKVLNFSIADSIGFGDKKRTQWINCAIWGKRAEALAQYLKKGMSVTAWGELELQEFDKRDGGRDKALRMNVSQIAMHSSKDREQSSGGPSSANHSSDDEIPF